MIAVARFHDNDHGEKKIALDDIILGDKKEAADNYLMC